MSVARNWDDDDDDDIDLVHTENEDGTRSLEARVVPRFPSHVYNRRRDGVYYPIDVWYQISKRIAPEDVGRFAAICPDTLAVTRSANFWFHTYRRFYRRCSVAPDDLLPETMALRYGLRARVIRSLQFTYWKYTGRTASTAFYTPEELLRRRCTSMWFHKRGEHWDFFFKFKPLSRHSRNAAVKLGAFEILDDVMANPENDCKILQISCMSFPDAPPAMGMILNILHSKLSSDMKHNNVYLGFSQGIVDNPRTQECSILLCNVKRIRVLNWWHPEYPRPENLASTSINNISREFENTKYS